jgi:Zn-dependent protease with chaperone function
MSFLIPAPVSWSAVALATWLLARVAGLGGLGLLARRLPRARAPLALRVRRSVAEAVLLRPALTVLALGALLTPTELGWGVVAAQGVMQAALWGLALGGGLALARGLGVARTGGPRLEGALRRVVAHLPAPPPRAPWALHLPQANAFAFTLSQDIGVTTPALEALEDDALDAVLAHEVAHLQEPLGLRVARIVPQSAMLLLALLPALWLRGAWVELMALFLGVTLLRLVVGRLSRRMEARADAAAYPVHAAALARGLEALYRVNLTPAVLGRANAAHPELVDRLEAAGVTPAWPRPAPPSRVRRAIIWGLMAPLIFGAILLSGAGA